jgi:hypothetical protein
MNDTISFDQLQAMGAKPINTAAQASPAPATAPTPDTVSFADLQKMGAKPIGEAQSAATPKSSDPFNSLTSGNKPSGLSGLYNAIASPFVGLAATPVQLLAKAMGKPDPFAAGIPSPAGPENAPTPVSPLGVENKVGDALQVASYAIPGEGVLGAVGAGAAQGAGMSMSKGGSLSDVAVNAGLGAATGGGVAGVTKLAGMGIGKVGQLLNGQQAEKTYAGIKDAYSSALNLNASQRAYENRSGKDLAQVLLDNRAPLGRYDHGTLDASKTIPILQDKLAPLDQQAQSRLSQLDTSHSINLTDQVLKPAIEKIRNLGASAEDETAIIQKATSAMQAEIKKWGNDVPPSILDQIKTGFWKTIGKGFERDTALRESATYQLGQAAKTAIEGVAPDMKPLNAQRGDLIDAITRLKKLDDVKVVKGGRLGNMAGGMVGAMAGAHAGPLGVLAGDYFGTKAAEFLNNPATQIGAAGAKHDVMSALPQALGSLSKPLGDLLQRGGQKLKTLGPRPAALITNSSRPQ